MSPHDYYVKLTELLAGSGNERNGISIDREEYLDAFPAEHETLRGVTAPRITFACIEGEYGWIEGNEPCKPSVAAALTLSEAIYLLKYGRLEKGAGEV